MPHPTWFGVVLALSAPLWLGIVVSITHAVDNPINQRIVIGTMIFWIMNVLGLDVLLGILLFLGGKEGLTAFWQSSWTWGMLLVGIFAMGNLFSFREIMKNIEKFPEDRDWNLKNILKLNYQISGLLIIMIGVVVVAVQTANVITQFSPK